VRVRVRVCMACGLYLNINMFCRYVLLSAPAQLGHGTSKKLMRN